MPAVHRHDQAESPASSVHSRDLAPQLSSSSVRSSTVCIERLQTPLAAPPSSGAAGSGEVAGTEGDAGPATVGSPSGGVEAGPEPPQAGSSVKASAIHESVRFIEWQTALRRGSDRQVSTRHDGPGSPRARRNVSLSQYPR